MRLTPGLPLATTVPEGLELALDTVRRLYARFLAALPLVAGGVLKQAVTAVEGVLEEPAPEVQLAELGDSSVDFEVDYRTACA